MEKARRIVVFGHKKKRPAGAHDDCISLGCLLVYDKVSGCWFCSCHGSRFDIHGRPLYGGTAPDPEKKNIQN